MKAKRLIIIIMISILTLSFSTFYSFGTTEKSTEIEARKAAIMHIVSDIKTDVESPWKGNDINLCKAKEVFNVKGELTGYLYNILVDGSKKGFIRIGNDLDEYPVMEWSYDGEQATNEQLNMAKQKISNEKIINKIRLISLCAGRYAYQFDMSDNSIEIVGTNGMKLGKLKSLTKPQESYENKRNARLLWKKIDQIASEIGTDNDGVTDVNPDNWESGYDYLLKHYISSVADKNQYEFSGGWTGCVPTAASNIMAYFGIIDTNQETTMWRLRYYMHTFQDEDGSGATYLSDIKNGMINYAKSVRPNSNPTVTIDGSWTNHTSVLWYGIPLQIDDDKPTLLTVMGQTYYCDGDEDSGHSVTLVGYKAYYYNGDSLGHRYMVIHDNWSTTPYNVYMAHGRDYDYLYQWVFNP